MKQSGVYRESKSINCKTPKSLEFSKSSKRVMPGGVTANIKFFEPYPTIMTSGSVHISPI